MIGNAPLERRVVRCVAACHTYGTMNNTAFQQILGGMVFVIFDVELFISNGWKLDVLPDVLGFLLIWRACITLATQSAQFRTAAMVALAAAAVWLISIPVPVLGSVFAVIDAILFWFVAAGVIDMALARDNQPLANVASTRRLWVIGIALAHIQLALVARLDFPGALLLLGLPLFVLAVVFGLLALGLMQRAARELA